MFLIGDLTSARTWLALISQLIDLLFGWVAVTVVLVLLAVGIPLLPLALVGLPVIGLGLRVATWYGAYERARFRFFLGAEVLALMAEGRSNSAIAHTLVVGGGAVEKHINNIFTKLDLAPADRDNRRVLAVLRYLNGAPS